MTQNEIKVPMEIRGLSPEQHKRKSLRIQYDLDNIEHELGWRINARYKTNQDLKRIATMNVQKKILEEQLHYHRRLAGVEPETEE